MRFEISYAGGTTHEVELHGTCVVGRDPACDIVLNDSKCSRRHAIVEDGPDGLVIRDSGSANGIYVNGKRVEKAPLRPGDTVRLGEVKLRLLAEIGETVIVAPEGLDLDAIQGGPSELGDTAPKPAHTPAPEAAPAPAAVSAPLAPAPPPRQSPPRAPVRPRPAYAREVREPPRGAGPARPATVSLLAGLWALFVPVAVAGALLGAARLSAGVLGWVLAAALAVVLAGLGTAMALGLRALAGWARHLQVATAAVGLLVCPFTLASATVLLYMTRPEVKAAFEGAAGARTGPDSAEATFALSLVGMLVLGLALTAIAVLVL